MKKIAVGPGYFRAMGIPVLRGREFDKRDTPHSPQGAILSHSFARKLFGDEDPIGHRVGYQPAPHDSDYVVIGEVGDARVDGLRAAAPPVAYFSLSQRPMLSDTIQVRTVGPVEKLFPVIRALLRRRRNPARHAHDPAHAAFDAGLKREKLLARLTGIFAFLVLLLAALGFYGLLSQLHVTRRTAEFASGIAIGATPSDVGPADPAPGLHNPGRRHNPRNRTPRTHRPSPQ